jgi:hypothetical protein
MLAEEIDAGEAMVYELFRALKKLEALDQLGEGRYRLASDNALAQAIRGLLEAAAPLADQAVDRPPSRMT